MFRLASRLLRSMVPVAVLLAVTVAPAATYANLFPAAAGHIILDGNLNPATWTSGGSLPLSPRQGSDLASAATMRSFLDLRGKAATAACAFSAGTPAATEAKFGTLLHRLLLHPVTISTPPQTYTYADTLAGVPLNTTREIGSGTAFSTGDWQSGATLLQRLWAASVTSEGPAAGGAADNALASGAVAADTPYTGLEQTYAVYCADSADPRAARAITRPLPGWPTPAQEAGAWTGPGPRKHARTGRAARARTATRAHGTGAPPAPSW